MRVVQDVDDMLLHNRRQVPEVHDHPRLRSIDAQGANYADVKSIRVPVQLRTFSVMVGQ